MTDNFFCALSERVFFIFFYIDVRAICAKFVPMKLRLPIFIVLILCAAGFWRARAVDPVVEPSYAWGILQPLGLHSEATIDTLLYNYYLTAVPSAVSSAFATTGNQASAGKNMIFMEQEPISPFFLKDAKRFWLPSEKTQRFYNTRIPMSIVGYNTGGGRDIAQDWFRFLFSGNFSPKAQVGLSIDYPYSKGSYANQAAKSFTWNLFGSYMGDRYEFQGYFNSYNALNQENGGITDDLYILDPAEIQGGMSKINPKNIPTNLTSARSRLIGKQLYMNHRYKVGFWKETYDSVYEDSIVAREYVPVSSFIWTMSYEQDRHKFYTTSSTDEEFWTNHYITSDWTAELTRYSCLRNTLGVALLEGFNKYAKAGLSAFITHELRTYNQVTDTIPLSGPDRPEALTPYPLAERLPEKTTENLLYVGAQLTKRQGSLLNYEGTVKFGLVGPAAGEIHADGNVSTRIRLLGDTVSIKGYGHFSNTTAPFFMKQFVSNHFIWQNDFGKTRRLRFGGILDVPHTGTNINVGVENIQNMIYFNDLCLPSQNGGSVQVLSVRLQQDFRWRALNWCNTVTYQKSSDESVLPLPQLAIYSNLFLRFKLAKVLDVQMGVDLDYYTRYYAPAYQPATMTFHNQSQIKCGNYPYMNAYVNMQLSRARFFVLFSHVNQGVFGGSDYFSIPHYPLNPRRFLMGVSVNFLN